MILNQTKKGVIHGETTSGVLNKVEDIGQLVKKYNPGNSNILKY
jgi:aspartate aminotransferase-like enzyme